MGVSSSVLQWSELKKSEALNRFVSPEILSPNHPFWNGLLSYRVKTVKTRSDWVEFEAEIEGLAKRLISNNKKSGNFGSLVEIFCSRQAELTLSVESDSSLFAWQAVNALFLIRICLKFFIERLGNEVDVLQQFEISPKLEADSGRGLEGENRLRRFIECVVAIIADLPENDQSYTYALRLEAVVTLLVALSAPLYHQRLSWEKSRTLKIVMTTDKAASVTSALLNFYVAQTEAPPIVFGDFGGGSLVLGLASGVWNILTLGYNSVASSAASPQPRHPAGNDDEMLLCSLRPLADVSLLLLLVVVNHGVGEEVAPDGASTVSKHPYRNALFQCKGSRETITAGNVSVDFSKLFSVLRATLDCDESSTLLLYLLLHRNSDFRSYILASSDIDLIVVPILKTLYFAAERNSHHIYMSLIILLILTEDDLFNASVHDNMVKGIDWYTERVLGEISLGGLFVLVVIRTIQHNMLKMRDKYLHTNCLAALANMSSHFKNLHPYVSQRIVSMFEALAKKYFKLMSILNESGIEHQEECSIEMDDRSALSDALSDATVLEEVLRMILEIINSCMVAQIKNNPNLIYTLLYKREVFQPLTTHQAFADLSQNLQTVITYFSSKLEQLQEKEGTALGVHQIQDFIRQTAIQFPREKLTKFPDLKFRYVEEEQPEDFFVPYTWTLVRRKIFWNQKYVKAGSEPI